MHWWQNPNVTKARFPDYSQKLCWWPKCISIFFQGLIKNGSYDSPNQACSSRSHTCQLVCVSKQNQDKLTAPAHWMPTERDIGNQASFWYIILSMKSSVQWKLSMFHCHSLVSNGEQGAYECPKATLRQFMGSWVSWFSQLGVCHHRLWSVEFSRFTCPDDWWCLLAYNLRN